jgi:hypothetical protein
MKLSQTTIDIIKNFSSINPGMIFKAGNQIKTVSPHKNVMGVATIQENFDTEVGIYDLNSFIPVISKDNDFDVKEDNIKIVQKLEFKDKNGKIKTATSVNNFKPSAKNLIVAPPDKPIQFPEPEIRLYIPSNIIDHVFTQASYFSSPHIGIVSDGQDVSLTAFDVGGQKSHSNNTSFEEGNGDTYSLHFKIDCLKLFPGDYDVEISTKGVSHWKNNQVDVEYWITIEPGSTYQKG